MPSKQIHPVVYLALSPAMLATHWDCAFQTSPTLSKAARSARSTSRVLNAASS